MPLSLCSGCYELQIVNLDVTKVHNIMDNLEDLQDCHIQTLHDGRRIWPLNWTYLFHSFWVSMAKQYEY